MFLEYEHPKMSTIWGMKDIAAIFIACLEKRKVLWILANCIFSEYYLFLKNSLIKLLH